MLGDLAPLHDQNGLIIGPEEPRPDLCLLVVDNGGGGIFGSLEQADPAYPMLRKGLRHAGGRRHPRADEGQRRHVA